MPWLCWCFAAMFLFGFGVLVTTLMVLVGWILFSKDTTPYAQRPRSRKEGYFVNERGNSVKFPSLLEDASLELSVIVPAYNEENRLRPMLDACLPFLVATYHDSFEVIVVSDGSTDGTCNVVMDYVRQYGSQRVRLLNLLYNRGKGAAVTYGMLSSRGLKLLFADADGATKIEDIEKLEVKLADIIRKTPMNERVNPIRNRDSIMSAVICGSRAHLEKEAKAKRSIFRTLLMIGFHIHVRMFGVKSVKDTQCGFKFFTRHAARVLFHNLHVNGWAFDVEMLYIAEKLNMRIGEVAVNWTEIEGSKLVPVWSWLEMGFDVLSIWLRYRTGAWKMRKNIPD